MFTTLYDTLFDTPFPAGIGERVAANRFTSDWDGREAERRLEPMARNAASTLLRY